MTAHLPSALLARDSDSRPYWEGLARGELRIQRCSACSRAVFYPRAICPHCYSDQLAWCIASGRGTIYAYTVAHQAFGPFADDTPFVVVIVELEEGVRMMSRLLNAPHERVTIGAQVQMTFEKVEEDLTLLYFRLLE